MSSVSQWQADHQGLVASTHRRTLSSGAIVFRMGNEIKHGRRERATTTTPASLASLKTSGASSQAGYSDRPDDGVLVPVPF